MALFNPLSDAFGLDIGDRSLKLIQVQKKAKAAKPSRLTAWGSIDVPEGVIENGEIVNLAKASEHAAQLVAQAKGRIRGRGVVACLPEAKSFVQIINVERGVDEDQLKKLITKEIEQNIPLPIGEIYFDWQVMDDMEAAEPEKPKKETREQGDGEREGQEKKEEREGEAEPPEGKADEQAEGEEAKQEQPPPPTPVTSESQTVRVLLGAAPKNLVDGYTQMLEDAGLAPLALEIEATAVGRALLPEDMPEDQAIGILDIGATRSSLAIFDEGALQMSIGIPISGLGITQMIAEKLQLTEEDAEKVKIECGLDAHRCEDKMWKILLPLIDDISAKIRNALRFYKIGFPSGKKIENLFLCGGGAHFRDIDSVLSRKLTIKVRRGEALANVKRLPKNFPQDQHLSYATAIGLALRASEEKNLYKRGLRF